VANVQIKYSYDEPPTLHYPGYTLVESDGRLFMKDDIVRTWKNGVVAYFK